MKKTSLISAIVVGCMVLADLAGRSLKWPRAEINAAILTTFVVGVVVSANIDRWKNTSYWMVTIGFLLLHSVGVLLATRFHFWGGDFKWWFLVGLLEIWTFERGTRSIAESRGP